MRLSRQKQKQRKFLVGVLDILVGVLGILVAILFILIGELDILVGVHGFWLAYLVFGWHTLYFAKAVPSTFFLEKGTPA